MLIDRIFNQDAISFPQRIDKRDHMISFPPTAARHPFHSTAAQIIQNRCEMNALFGAST
ncbi:MULTISPECIES: hypothetical protein [Burkholderia]|uniref:hypothetical protein n=1 Tax=Burkholderia TaxID=32008 RepID=UPI0013A52C3F|nr:MULTISPECIES: hypothetical protein [Burkholderia]ELK7723045.1 hypothetical protein [Burkholderia cenocepacia]MBL3967292.1 hypothetical protein [Burkholderia sp. KCJ3K979]MBR8308356.1 hypothetical protein [Burkholderia cenocepacia]MCA7963797.1 hypothetical protein [Burkholderia cenocepacia]MDR8059409.1 hypothetical protein [Burkholderia cenocepacia]